MEFVIAAVLMWFALGAVAAKIGNDELRRQFPNVPNDNLWINYVTSVLGPCNLIAVWIVFFSGLNARNER